MSVLPVPGSPSRRMPFGGRAPNFENDCNRGTALGVVRVQQARLQQGQAAQSAWHGWGLHKGMLVPHPGE
eukprot:134203-Chlamydomonas_euryale.AAC.1